MKKLIVAGSLALSPMIVFAQDGVGGVLDTLGGIINTLTPIVVALAVLFFFWGLANYILKTGDEEGRAGARHMMIWGVIILFVMVSVFGLIGLLRDTIDLPEEPIVVPAVETE
jgi:hypothetical protein